MVKICPICRATFPSKAALAAHVASAHPAGASRGRRRGANRAPGSITITNTEFLGSQKRLSVPLLPGKSGAGRLDAHAQIYELFRFQRVSLTLRSTAGLSVSGSTFAGVSYDATAPEYERSSIAALTPSASAPVTRDITLSVPTGPLMGQQWLPTHYGSSGSEVPGFVVFDSDSNMDVWLTYTCVFTGTRTPTSSGFLAGYDPRTTTWVDDTKNKVDSIPAANASNVEVEIGSADQSIVEKVLGPLQTLWTNAREIHRITQGAITFVHLVVDAVLRATPPALAVAAPVILHTHEQPFRIRALRGLIGLPPFGIVGDRASTRVSSSN